MGRMANVEEHAQCQHDWLPTPIKAGKGLAMVLECVKCSAVAYKPSKLERLAAKRAPKNPDHK